MPLWHCAAFSLQVVPSPANQLRRAANKLMKSLSFSALWELLGVANKVKKDTLFAASTSLTVVSDSIRVHLHSSYYLICMIR